jgi:hypothetical protein
MNYRYSTGYFGSGIACGVSADICKTWFDGWCVSSCFLLVFIRAPLEALVFLFFLLEYFCEYLTT